MERTKRAIGREMRGRSKRKSIVLTTWWNNFSLSLSYKRRKTRLRGVLRIWEDEVLSVGVSSSLPLSILCSILTQGRRWSICSRRKPVSSQTEFHHSMCWVCGAQSSVVGHARCSFSFVQLIILILVMFSLCVLGESLFLLLFFPHVHRCLEPACSSSRTRLQD